MIVCGACQQRLLSRSREGKAENKHKKIIPVQVDRRRLHLFSTGRRTSKLVCACIHKSIVMLWTNFGTLIPINSEFLMSSTMSGTFALYLTLRPSIQVVTIMMMKMMEGTHPTWVIMPILFPTHLHLPSPIHLPTLSFPPHWRLLRMMRMTGQTCCSLWSSLVGCWTSCTHGMAS